MKADRLLLVAALVLALVGASAPLWWRFGPIDVFYFQYLAVGASLIVGGYICSRWRAGRPIARLMLLTACLWFLPSVGYGHNALLFTIGLIANAWWLPVAGHFTVAFPEGVLRSRVERAVVAAGYLLTLVVHLGLVFYDPATDCQNCPPNLILISSQPAITNGLSQLGGLVQLVLALAVLALVIRRFVRATRPERRVVGPVFAAMLLNVAAVIVGSVIGALTAAGALPLAVFGIAVFVQELFLILLPISFGIGIARGVLAQSAVGNLMVRIGQGRSASEIERDVAWALADPTAHIALSPDGGAFTTVGGLRVDVDQLPAGSVRLIEGSTGVSAALIVDPAVSQLQPELLDAVVSATRLALENQRLESEVQLASTLPVGLAERLQREGNRIGETKTMNVSVLMSDIRGYSTIAEGADPRELAAQLNEHRAQMNRVIAAAGGTVMQFVGDSVFAVFGAPEPTPDHARRAVGAAVDMQAAQKVINESWSSAGRPAFGLGIAVTTGDVAAALLGSAEHVEYSVVGDVVNLAQRIQAWAQPGEVVVNDETHRQMGDGVASTQLPTATVKGRQGQVTAYMIAPA